VDSKHHHHINPFIQNAERPISNFLHRKRSEWEKKKKKFKNVTNYRYRHNVNAGVNIIKYRLFPIIMGLNYPVSKNLPNTG
jgi:hypothetical protein